VLFRRRGFIETGSKQSVTDRLGREELPATMENMRRIINIF